MGVQSATHQVLVSQMLEQIADHGNCVQKLAQQVALLDQISGRIIKTFESGGKLYVIGNGGSAADAQHIAAELVGRFKQNRRPLPAVALTTDTSTLTAIANDFGYQHVFQRQVEALVTPHDAVWALSVSGTSPNVLSGLEAARRKNAFVVGFTSRQLTSQNPARSGESDKKTFAQLCDLCFHADHTSSDRVQEMHQLAYHLICQAVEAHFAA